MLHSPPPYPRPEPHPSSPSKRSQPPPALLINEILATVLEHLAEPRDLIASSLCCSRWEGVARPLVWRRLVLDTCVPAFGYTAPPPSPTHPHLPIPALPISLSALLPNLVTETAINRLTFLAQKLTQTPSLAKRIHTLSLRLSFRLTCTIGSTDLEESALPPATRRAAWETFVQRADMCISILALAANVRRVNVRVDVDLDGGDDSERTLFAEIVERIGAVLRIVGGRGVKVGVEIGEGGEEERVERVWPLFCGVGMRLCCFVLDDALRWAPAMLVKLLKGVELLERFELRDGAAVTSAVLEALIPHHRTLRHLHINLPREFSSDLLSQTIPQTRLKSLTLTRALVSHALPKPRSLRPPAFQTLESLTLTSNPLLTPGLLIHLTSTAPNLAHLTARTCTLLTDTSIATVATHCPYLQSLDLAHCGLLTSSTLAALAHARMQRLRTVSLKGCARVVAPGAAGVVADIAHACPKLVAVELGPVGTTAEFVAWRAWADLGKGEEGAGGRFPVIDMELSTRLSFAVPKPLSPLDIIPTLVRTRSLPVTPLAGKCDNSHRRPRALPIPANLSTFSPSPPTSARALRIVCLKRCPYGVTPGEKVAVDTAFAYPKLVTVELGLRLVASRTPSSMSTWCVSRVVCGTHDAVLEAVLL
ncbi:hypothetical protein BDK51DRAFT_50975 [Blyttiomyces helicus]|uniref:F-box domain-containing protein n=1 Tax=Blyttiomyces helicus TaxID=388810 RepID=A0A4P9WGB6_9FUNG|nr:hypothetical protein BDK51DRAFT_50975 [Blyttiomyces helicus]|eukprot:RKO90853.1 hypothetical protein BDK51DRAFT_50975 [Blyttiomyces helicus]